MTSETVQGGRSTVVLMMTGSSYPVNELPSMVGSSLMIVGCAMRLASTKYIRHGVGTGAPCAIEY